MFQIASHLSLTLRLALIFHGGSQPNLARNCMSRWARPPDVDELKRCGDRKAIVDDLRRRTEALAGDIR